MKIVLHNFWRSSASYRVRIGLALKQLPYEYVSVNIGAGGQFADAYRAVNPMAQVPTLAITEDDGTAIALTQSLAILEYLEERWPEPAILPRDPVLRARTRALAEIANAGIQPLHNSTTLRRIKELGADETAWALPFVADGLAAFARVVAATAGAFCVG
ncbi:MAG TPA: glutathione S-transferase N-terminal domain-containing protein, partial [Kofleriaceae bacterium]|nr:glutathione S-transferase N-terminal domain-containing protein [Kofleriaceae bacterium]